MALLRTARMVAQLSPRKAGLLLEASAWLLASRVALAVFGLARVQKHFGRRSGFLRQTVHSRADIAWAVRAVANRLPGMTCLPRAVALRALLARAGMNSELHIGVALESGKLLRAHAWVTCDGVLLDSAEHLHGYTALPALPS